MTRTRIGLFVVGLFVIAILVGGVLTWAGSGGDSHEPPLSTQATQQAPTEKTGSAGLLDSTGTSIALVISLGVFAAAMLAGGRSATRGPR